MADEETLTEEQVYKLYSDLLNELNQVCNNTMDQSLEDLVCPMAQSLSNWLTDANEVALDANMALFTALTPEMKSANSQLKELKVQIAGMAEKIADAGKVLEGVTKVLELTAKFA